MFGVQNCPEHERHVCVVIKYQLQNSYTRNTVAVSTYIVVNYTDCQKAVKTLTLFVLRIFAQNIRIYFATSSNYHCMYVEVPGLHLLLFFDSRPF